MKFLNWTLSLALTLGLLTGCAPAASGSASAETALQETGSTVTAGETTTVTQNRLVGFYRACEELGLEIPEEYVREAAYHDPDRCAATTMELMQLPERPTCILFPDDYSYVGGQNALAQMGLQIPEDVSVMGYDGIHLARVLGLTTYRQDTEALGRIAADRLISLIEHPKTTLVDRIMVSGELIPGKTVKRLTK